MPVALSVFVFAAFSFFVMMHVKTDVQSLSTERSALLKEQRLMKEDLRVLRAEFAHLSRPERLWQFAEGLELREMEPYQLADAPVVNPELVDFVQRVSFSD